jgi:hypothetical protein
MAKVRNRNEDIDIVMLLKAIILKKHLHTLDWFKKLQIGVNNRVSNEQICQHVSHLMYWHLFHFFI